MVVNIIRPRLEETFELVKDRLDAAGLSAEIGRRVVLTGGASQLVGARELAARVLDRQVRLGRPHAVRGLPETASGPAFAATLGLLAWGAGEGRPLLDLLPGAERPRRNVPPRRGLVAGSRLMRFTRKTRAPMRVPGKRRGTRIATLAYRACRGGPLA